MKMISPLNVWRIATAGAVALWVEGEIWKLLLIMGAIWFVQIFFECYEE